MTIEVDGVRRSVAIDGMVDEGLTTTGPTGGVTWRLQAPFADPGTREAGSGPVATLPGTVIAVSVTAGDHVADGDMLMMIEAMKMEHKIVASAPATVTSVRFEVGDRVDAGDLLVELDYEE